MEELRQELYKFVEQYGTLDKRTIDASQKLDKLILGNMNKRLGGVKNGQKLVCIINNNFKRKTM